ncbi:MAG: sigma-70 family RNA polymerase sigma factor [Alphaproteobacteria bacterium]|nr:sigma-70 family RNA polymerase sigma factor [Alphaproteobacteria bacterium]
MSAEEPTPSAVDAEVSDAELVRRIAQGNERAFSILENRHRRPTNSYLRKVGGAGGWADDAYQELWWTVWRQASSYKPARGEVRAWIFGIAHRILWNVGRRDARYSARHHHPPTLVAVDGRSTDPRQSLDLWRALEALEFEDRAVLMQKAEGLTSQQGSALMGMKPDAWRKRVERARARLADLLGMGEANAI